MYQPTLITFNLSLATRQAGINSWSVSDRIRLLIVAVNAGDTAYKSGMAYAELSNDPHGG